MMANDAEPKGNPEEATDQDQPQTTALPPGVLRTRVLDGVTFERRVMQRARTTHFAGAPDKPKSKVRRWWERWPWSKPGA